MKQIAFKGRLLLRKILTALSLGAVAVTFQACYGMPGVAVSGTVRSADTHEPIPGISVSVYGYSEYFTDGNGKYELFFDGYGMTTISFKDVDGPENGEFKDMDIRKDVQKNASLNVALERK
ncbi:MAG: carboxypeptidase-like regulatory domain-containing protein [Treponema sp.]|jgi:hypothetical protein|nr:carboxypeptidase-like regulatory domain-containing protein [Treponema sp.]